MSPSAVNWSTISWIVWSKRVSVGREQRIDQLLNFSQVRLTTMDITEEQLPPTSRPPMPDKGVPSDDKPDTGSRPDLIHPETPEEDAEPMDPLPDIDPDGKDPVDGETIN
jgi:hypothetical protein